MVQKYGNYIRLWKGSTCLQVIISDPDCIEEILTSNVHLDKGNGYDGYIKWLGTGLVNGKSMYNFCIS